MKSKWFLKIGAIIFALAPFAALAIGVGIQCGAGWGLATLGAALWLDCLIPSNIREK